MFVQTFDASAEFVIAELTVILLHVCSQVINPYRQKVSVANERGIALDAVPINEVLNNDSTSHDRSKRRHPASLAVWLCESIRLLIWL